MHKTSEVGKQFLSGDERKKALAKLAETSAMQYQTKLFAKQSRREQKIALKKGDYTQVQTLPVLRNARYEVCALKLFS